MTTIIIILAIWGIYRLLKGIADRAQADRAERERQRIREEQERIKAEQIRQREVERARLAWQKRQEQINRENAKEQQRIAKEQEQTRKEQKRQAAQPAKHEQELVKIDNRLFAIEGEISHNREMVDRIAKLIQLEEEEQSKCTKDSAEWAKHEKKIISLTNQQYNAQKKINKAKADKRICEQKLSA